MRAKFVELDVRLREAHDLLAARATLIWDRLVCMPSSSAGARARQTALLIRLAYARLADPEVGRLIDALEPWVATLPPDSYEAALVHAARRDHDHTLRVPDDLLGAYSQHLAESYQAWIVARPGNDFAAMLPYLRTTLDYSRRVADCSPGYEHIADPLIDHFDFGMKAKSLRALFAELRAGLVPIAQAIAALPVADDACLHGDFPAADQVAFGKRLVEAIGFDFSRGRQDQCPHPFTYALTLNDVRVTTRVDERNLRALFCTLHEAGHALYEQGIAPEYDGTFLAHAASTGVHESQARIWEILVGHSLSFWEAWYEPLRATFPRQLGSVSLDTFYRAINKVEGSPIRVDADELTYNLHVIIRFDLELALLDGSLAPHDLPEAWRARYTEDLGVTPSDDREGVLQDAHWFQGLIGGAFQGYALGNLLSVQFYEQALRDEPGLSADLRKGDTSTLLAWLRRTIHRPGQSLTAPELIRRVTGGEVRVAPYLRYLRTKYGKLYGI